MLSRPKPNLAHIIEITSSSFFPRLLWPRETVKLSVETYGKLSAAVILKKLFLVLCGRTPLARLLAVKRRVFTQERTFSGFHCNASIYPENPALRLNFAIYLGTQATDRNAQYLLRNIWVSCETQPKLVAQKENVFIGGWFFLNENNTHFK